MPCRNFFEFTVASYRSKINVTGLPLARYTFFESFPKNNSVCKALTKTKPFCLFLMEFSQVPCRNFFEFTVASYRSKINVTGLPLARYTFFESFPKNNSVCKALTKTKPFCLFLMEFSQVPCRNFFEFTVASYRSKINVTGLPLARYTFFESFPKKTLGLQNLIWKIWI